MSDTQTRVTLVVPSRPAPVFDLLARPARLADIDASGTILSAEDDGPVTEAGQTRRMSMVALGGQEPTRYRAEHRIEVFEPGRRIGWAVVPLDGDPAGWSWHFELTPLDDERTEVALTYDWSETSAENAARYGIPDHDALDLEACLTRLALAVKK